jgi:hypothetical protein
MIAALTGAAVGAVFGAVFGIRHGRAIAKVKSAAQEIAHRETTAQAVENAIGFSRFAVVNRTRRGGSDAQDSGADRSVPDWHNRLRATDPHRRD